MPRPITVPFNSGTEVAANYVIRLTALSPTDGSTVAGVKISAGAVLAVDVGGTTVETPAPTPVNGAYTTG